MKAILILAALVLCAVPCRADYTGTVSGVKTFSGGAVAIDLDGAYPHEKMMLYIRASNVEKFTLPHEGDVVKATGPTTAYKGKPEIVLKDPAQLTTVKP